MRYLAALFAFAALAAIAVIAAEPDPKILSYKMPDDIQWERTSSGVLQKVLFGDPSKPGWYIVLAKWEKGKMSRPHTHPNARYITVMSGTWWIGTGTKYDPASTKPMPAGSFVTHFANQPHYDGAKDEDAIIQIVGMGPATSTAAEAK